MICVTRFENSPLCFKPSLYMMHWSHYSQIRTTIYNILHYTGVRVRTYLHCRRGSVEDPLVEEWQQRELAAAPRDLHTQSSSHEYGRVSSVCWLLVWCICVLRTPQQHNKSKLYGFPTCMFLFLTLHYHTLLTLHTTADMCWVWVTAIPRTSCSTARQVRVYSGCIMFVRCM